MLWRASYQPIELPGWELDLPLIPRGLVLGMFDAEQAVTEGERWLKLCRSEWPLEFVIAVPSSQVHQDLEEIWPPDRMALVRVFEGGFWDRIEPKRGFALCVNGDQVERCVIGPPTEETWESLLAWAGRFTSPSP
jgi:hypothetical protein